MHCIWDLLVLVQKISFWTISETKSFPKSPQFADYRPIASIRLFYKIFADMILAHVEPALEFHQPEEQHEFRKGHRIEKYLLTANLVVNTLQLA